MLPPQPCPVPLQPARLAPNQTTLQAAVVKCLFWNEPGSPAGLDPCTALLYPHRSPPQYQVQILSAVIFYLLPDHWQKQ